MDVRLNQAINRVKVKTAQSVPAGKTWSGCEVAIGKGSTPCLRESIRQHEEIHRLSCEATTQGFFGQDHKRQLSHAEYIEEDMKAYEAEITFINAELERLSQCADPLSRSNSPILPLILDGTSIRASSKTGVK